MLTEYTYKWDYRNTKMGGLTKAVAICPKCRKVIEPSRIERSKAGTHGKDYYVHEHQLSFIIIGQTNSGQRYVDSVNVEPGSELKNYLISYKIKAVRLSD
jgi:hypothetical protein